MKVQPIPEELWKALNIVGHEVDDAISSLTLIEDDFSAQEKKDFELLKNSASLLSEYAACFTAKGELSQRGYVPHAWNEDTIFTPYEERIYYNDNEANSEGNEDTDSSRNPTVSEDA